MVGRRVRFVKIWSVAALAAPLQLTSRHLKRTYDGLSAAVGLATILLGCYIVYRIGVGDGVVG
jgi:hypothetical protein